MLNVSRYVPEVLRGSAFEVEGSARLRSGLPVAGLRVEVSLSSTQAEQAVLLGVAVTDEQGMFRGPGPNGLELVKHLVARSPRLPVLVVSMHEEALFAERALYAGARGYLMKTAAQEQIVVAVRRLLGGRLYFSTEVQQRLLHAMVGGAPERERPALASLTDRELEVFEHLGMGRTNKEIAEAMLIRPRTVEAYRRSIRERLGLRNSSQLLRCAVLWVGRQRAA